MRHLITSILFAALFAGSMSGAADAADKVQLKAVSVHLFLEKSGTFSPDILAISDFHSWNFVPGGNGIPDDENFSAILVKVRLASTKEIFAKGKQGQVAIVSRKDRKPIRSDSIADVYVSGNGEVYRAFYIPDVACKEAELTVTVHDKTIRKQLSFRCGE